MKGSFSLFSFFLLIWLLEIQLIEDCSLQALVCFSSVKDDKSLVVILFVFTKKLHRSGMLANLLKLLCFEFHQLPERWFSWCREALRISVTFAIYFQFQTLCRNRGGFLKELLTKVETLEQSSLTGNKKAQSKRSDEYLLRCVWWTYTVLCLGKKPPCICGNSLAI